MQTEEFAASVRTLPTEIIRAIFIAGVEDKYWGKVFGARSCLTASYVRSWITPSLYRVVDLWTDAQARSFLSTIENDATSLPYQYRNLVQSLIIKTAAFSAYETQNAHAQIEPGNFTPMGVTSDSAIKILAVLSQADCVQWQDLDIPMVILATRRVEAIPPINAPQNVTLSGVDGLIWRAYNWNSLTRIRFTSYNPTFQETRWLVRLPQLTHCAFAFYHEPPLGTQIVEELAAVPRMKCVLVVVYPSSQRGPGKVDTAIMRQALSRLNEPKLVVWQNSPNLVKAFEDEDVHRFWKRVEAITEEQQSEKQIESNGGAK